METRRSSGFPTDVPVALILPAIAIFALLFGFQRVWILLVVAGFVQLLAVLSVLRRSSFSVAAWLALALGVTIIAAGIRFTITL